MAGTIKRLAGPAALANAAANVYNQGSDMLYTVIRHIMIVNKTGAAATFRLFVGATGGSAAGTEVVGFDKSVQLMILSIGMECCDLIVLIFLLVLLLLLPHLP